MEDTYTVRLDTKNGESKEFKLLDTAGEEDYQNMLDQWITAADGFILVFAINDMETFEAIPAKVRRIEKNDASKLPKILVGNKCDLQDERKVTMERAKAYAESIKAKYFETSALTDANKNVKKVFEECANMIVGAYSPNDGNNKPCFKCSIF